MLGAARAGLGPGPGRALRAARGWRRCPAREASPPALAPSPRCRGPGPLPSAAGPVPARRRRCRPAPGTPLPEGPAAVRPPRGRSPAAFARPRGWLGGPGASSRPSARGARGRPASEQRRAVGPGPPLARGAEGRERWGAAGTGRAAGSSPRRCVGAGPRRLPSGPRGCHGWRRGEQPRAAPPSRELRCRASRRGAPARCYRQRGGRGQRPPSPGSRARRWAGLLGGAVRRASL